VSKLIVATWSPFSPYRADVWVTPAVGQTRLSPQDTRGHPVREIVIQRSFAEGSLEGAQAAAKEIREQAEREGNWMGPHIGLILLKGIPQLVYDTADEDFDPDTEGADERGGSTKASGITMKLSLKTLATTPERLADDLRMLGNNAHVVWVAPAVPEHLLAELVPGLLKKGHALIEKLQGTFARERLARKPITIADYDAVIDSAAGFAARSSLGVSQFEEYRRSLHDEEIT